MFIKDVITKIWEPVSRDYMNSYQEAIKMSGAELFQSICKDLDTFEIGVYRDENFTMTGLATSGCPHCKKDGNFCGCSFCDFCSDFPDMLARTSALRQKDQSLYTKAIRHSFEVARGTAPQPNSIELVSGFDTLNPEEFPDQAVEGLFGKEGLFKGKPFKYVLETRLSSITRESLMRWKEKLGKRVVVEVGVEIRNEWLRNYWLNKNISDEQIKKGIELIHENGWEVSANLLIGIPGLTEEQSLELFCDSFLWLDSLGADHIICSALTRKEKTVQGFIHEKLNHSAILNDIGIINGNQTGMPWIFTVIKALQQVAKLQPGFIQKITLNDANFCKYFELIQGYHGNSDTGRLIADVIQNIQNIKSNGKDFIQNDLTKMFKDEPYYHEYLSLIDKQKKAGDLKNTMKIVAQEIAKVLWENAWEEKMRNFEEELILFGNSGE